MSKGAYIGVGNSAKKIKNIYIGVNGVAKKVKKAYIGVNNVAKLWWSSSYSKQLLSTKLLATSITTSYGAETSSYLAVKAYASKSDYEHAYFKHYAIDNNGLLSELSGEHDCGEGNTPGFISKLGDKIISGEGYYYYNMQIAIYDNNRVVQYVAVPTKLDDDYAQVFVSSSTHDINNCCVTAINNTGSHGVLFKVTVNGTYQTLSFRQATSVYNGCPISCIGQVGEYILAYSHYLSADTIYAFTSDFVYTGTPIDSALSEVGTFGPNNAGTTIYYYAYGASSYSFAGLRQNLTNVTLSTVPTTYSVGGFSAYKNYACFDVRNNGNSIIAKWNRDFVYSEYDSIGSGDHIVHNSKLYQLNIASNGTFRQEFDFTVYENEFD